MIILNKEIKKVIYLSLSFFIIFLYLSNYSFGMENIHTKVGLVKEIYWKEDANSVKLSMDDEIDGAKTYNIGIATIHLEVTGLGNEIKGIVKGIKPGEEVFEFKYYITEELGDKVQEVTASFNIKVDSDDSDKYKPQDDSASFPASKRYIPVTIKAQQYMAIEDANIRSENNIDNPPVGVLKKGETVKSDGITGNNWIRIRYNGKAAYINLKQLNLVGEDEVNTALQQENEKEKAKKLEELKRKNQIINNEGKNKEEQIKELKDKLGTIPNVGSNLYLKIFIITTMGIILYYFLKERKVI